MLPSLIALRLYMICEDNPPKIPTEALLYAFGASEIEARALAKVTKTPSGNLAHFLPRSAKQKRGSLLYSARTICCSADDSSELKASPDSTPTSTRLGGVHWITQ